MEDKAPVLPVSQFIAEARKLVGIKFVHQGRTKHGVDCLGLLALSTQNAGFDLAAYFGVKDVTNYGLAPDPRMLENTAAFCKRIKEPVPGCIMLFRFPGWRVPTHFAVYTERKSIIHADVKIGRVVEHGYGAPWTRLAHSTWLLAGVIYD